MDSLSAPTPGFSDEDLKRLENSSHEDCEWIIPWDKFQALLRRLRAGEDCIDDHRKDCLADIGNPCTCGYAEKLAIWRKSKGDIS